MTSSSKRDSLSPASGASLRHASSSDSLNAHPLLSPNSPSSSNRDTSATTPPRYVPYTPRHRPLVSSATTGMTTHGSMPVTSQRNQEGGATSKLQLQNLKASSQSIGLGSGTLGWAMLERLVDAETNGEWDEIWTILTTAKPTLLLPLEPFSGELITPEFIKDHIAFCNGPASSSSPLVTLSGLRGFINNSVLTFRSTIPPSSMPFVDLYKPELQTLALTSLPPLPSTRLSVSGAPFPSIALPATASLPIPPRPHHSRAYVPSRLGASSSTPPKSQGGSRIINPFASLFSRPPSSSTNTLSLSPSQSQSLLDDAQGGGSVDLVAFSLGKKITKQSVGKELSKAIKDEIKADLAGCPTWVIDRVLEFTGPLYPIPRTSRRTEASHDARPQVPPSTQLPDPSSLAEVFQSFYVSIEDDLRASVAENLTSERAMATTRKINHTQNGSSAAEKESSEGGNETESRLKENVNPEMNIKGILEQVESVICTVFYDRTFRPLAGDDASHDDALANRIAALSLLDLGLEHLGVEIPKGTARSDVDNVIKSCGESLQALEDSQHRSPKQKSALLVEAHQKLVEGISRLPQLRLKPENDVENQDSEQETPRAASFGKQAAKEAIEQTSTSSMTLHSNYKLSGDTDTVVAETIPEGASVTMSRFEAELAPEPANVPPEDTEHVHTYEFAQDPGKVSFSSPKSSPPAAFPHLHSPTLASRFPVAAPISGDLLFPLLIFSVVKSNPPHLVSHLLYTQRFRSRRVGGRESYCLINLMAVVEFLEHVDMGALGLGDSERVMSTADLTPITLAHGSIDSSAVPPSPLASRLGRRVNQQVEELAGLAGSANRVITGVVDSSFGVLRGFLAPNPDLSIPHNDTQDPAPWNHPRPGFGLLRRGPGFSIASVAASLPGAGRAKTSAGGADEEGQQLLEVPSRPGSVREANIEDERDEDTTGSSVESSDDSHEGDVADREDSRSVRSFSSMMNRESRDRDRVDNKERVSLTDRLANMPSLSRLGTGEQLAAKPSPPPSLPTSRPTSWLPPAPFAPQPADTLAPSLNSSVSHFKIRVPPPNRRFLECAENDIRVGEVVELLHEYRRLAQALQAAGAFGDHA